jgi:hypothetical protein
MIATAQEKKRGGRNRDCGGKAKSMSRPFAEDHDDDFDGIGRERSAPPLPRRNGPAARAPIKPKFQLMPFNNIKFEAVEEWLVKKLLPRKGVAAIYGASGSVKTFCTGAPHRRQP